MLKNFYFKGIKVTCCNLDSAVRSTLAQINCGEPGYICVTDAGNIVNAVKRNSRLREAINNSLISLPDGRPISIFAGLKGIRDITRVAGPDFMEEIFSKSAQYGLKHFFLGDTDEIQNKLIKKVSSIYKIQIAGNYSPEFGNPDRESNSLIIKKINESGADIIWVSFGGGRQEVWMMDNYRELRKGVMVGVGAAFRFYTGKIKRAPKIFQQLGLEWFFRLVQQPEKMFKRYITTLPYFALYSFKEFFRKLN